MTLAVVKFEPVSLGRPVGIDGLDLHCHFEQYWCVNRITLAGGLDAHHMWPKSMGGSEAASDTQHLLYLCPMHHRRQHALIRAMVESGTTAVHPVRYYAPAEVEAATYAVTMWNGIGKPAIHGWETPAAVLRAA